MKPMYKKERKKEKTRMASQPTHMQHASTTLISHTHHVVVSHGHGLAVAVSGQALEVGRSSWERLQSQVQQRGTATCKTTTTEAKP